MSVELLAAVELLAGGATTTPDTLVAASSATVTLVAFGFANLSIGPLVAAGTVSLLTLPLGRPLLPLTPSKERIFLNSRP